MKTAVDAGKTAITFSTKEAGPFEISSDLKSSNVALTVNAPNAHIENATTFKSITIQAIGENTWVEKGATSVKNDITVTASTAKIEIKKGSTVQNITVSSEKAETPGTVTITANGSISGGVTVTTADTNLALSGSGSTKESPITVTIAETAKSEDSATQPKVTANTPVAVETAVNAEIKLTSDAQGSSIKITADTKSDEAVKVDVINNSGAPVTVTDKDDNKLDDVQSTDDDTPTSVIAAKDAVTKIAAAITWNNIKGSNTDSKAVTSNLNLATTTTGLNIPSNVVSGAAVTISWASSDTAVVGTDGTITKPEKDTEVTLTATVTDSNDNSKTAKATITVTVKGKTAPITYTATVEITVATNAAITTTGTSVSVSVKASDNSSVASPTYALVDDASSKPEASIFKSILDRIDTLDPSGTKYLWVKIGDKYYSASINFESGKQDNITLTENTLQ